MEVALKKWGNSQGLRIPKDYLSLMGVDIGTPLTMNYIDGNIVISKKYIHKTLKERVEESGKPICFEREYEWGDPEGREVW